MNRLADEKSPYLLQHSRNPVHWWPWCDEAVETARREDKPIFLSIGYSTCYWCHVMESESFENEAVASILNDSFVCIKVDREERPDLDAVYMEAVVSLNGHGGWPLSVFLDTDLKPFFGGTYFPAENFVQILQKLSSAWDQNRDQVTHASAQLYDVIQVMGRSTKATPLEVSLWQQAYTDLQQSYDSEWGGFGSAPKFPSAGIIRVLLRYYRRFNDENALAMAATTLEQMCRGGLYDQIGGGFHRYSVDREWLVPHFEKMLYDNALLVPAYLEAWQLTSNPLFKRVAQETLDYACTEMQAPQGGFYSAQDAGAVGREGEYYVWSEAELRDQLDANEFELATKLFGISASGNYESGFCIPRVSEETDWSSRYSSDALSLVQTLAELRATRTAPALDDKILTSWNALTVSALCKGYQILGEAKYLIAATRTLKFIQESLVRDGTLLRRYRDGEAAHSAQLEDYAFLIQALLDVFQCDGNHRWIQWAKELQSSIDALFWDTTEGGYFSASAEDANLIVRRKEHSDSALPSASAIAAMNLFKLSILLNDSTLRERGQAVLEAYSGFTNRYPSAFAYTLMSLEFEHFGPVEVLLVGETPGLLSVEEGLKLWAQFQPTLIVAQGESGTLPILENRESPAIFLCADGSCSTALRTIDEVVSELTEKRMQ